MKSKQKYAVILSVLIAVLATIAAAGGLLLDGLYRDNEFVTTTWLGNDAVTLFLAVPILVAALVFTGRGSLKAQLVWLGVLDYMLYNYAFYLFGAAFNAFFLIYAALLGLSIFALIFGLVSLDVTRVSQQFSRGIPVRWIGGYFLFVALGLSVVYLAQSIGFYNHRGSSRNCHDQRTPHQRGLRPGFDPAHSLAGSGCGVADETPVVGVRGGGYSQRERTPIYPDLEREQYSGAEGRSDHYVRTAFVGFPDCAGFDCQRIVLPTQTSVGWKR